VTDRKPRKDDGKRRGGDRREPRRGDARKRDEERRGGRPAGGRGRAGSGGGRTSSAKGRTTGGRGRARDRDDDARKGKRTSKSTDDRNPTRSGTQYPPKRYRARGEDTTPEAGSHRPVLRTVRSKTETGARKQPTDGRRGRAAPTRRRRGRSTEAMEELAKLAGRNARKAQDQLAAAATAYQAGRERDAMRNLRPLRDAYPDASAVRELLGLCHYRIGQYPAAAKELEMFVELTDSVEQHPVLMDCYRAAGRSRRIDELWEELATASPSAALVTEGRIVYAGSLADRGKLRDAISTLERRAGAVQRVQEHHLRLWYALADLDERAGDIPRARQLFERIRRHDAGFADVAERLAALG
jgi:tetratricopeptide (TPR) repeat protein